MIARTPSAGQMVASVFALGLIALDNLTCCVPALTVLAIELA
jgi:hypothetical protein